MTKHNEKLLYIPNAAGYNLIMFTLALNTVYSLLTINKMAVNGYLFFEVMFDIVFTLFLFLMSVEVKMYSRSWSWAAFFTGFVQVARVMLIPKEITFAQKGLLVNARFSLIVYLILGGITCTIGGIVGIKKHALRKKVSEAKHG